MVSAAEIHPFHPVQEFTEFLLHCIQRYFQIICILLTECMKMYSLHTIQKLRPKPLPCHPQTGPGSAGIIDRMAFLCGTLGINAYPHAFPAAITRSLYLFICSKELKTICPQ